MPLPERIDLNATDIDRISHLRMFNPGTPSVRNRNWHIGRPLGSANVLNQLGFGTIPSMENFISDNHRLDSRILLTRELCELLHLSIILPSRWSNPCPDDAVDSVLFAELRDQVAAAADRVGPNCNRKLAGKRHIRFDRGRQRMNLAGRTLVVSNGTKTNAPQFFGSILRQTIACSCEGEQQNGGGKVFHVLERCEV